MKTWLASRVLAAAVGAAITALVNAGYLGPEAANLWDQIVGWLLVARQ